MNNSNDFFIVKYIPDLQRNEPRNIGIIFEYSSLFLGEKDGTVKEDDIPDFVFDNNAYVQWFNYFKKELNNFKNENRPLESILGISKGNYIVVKAGTVLDEVKDQVDCVQYLFNRLVI
jgi:hypothetical protein